MAISRTATLLERFNMQYEPEPMSGCWLWTGAVVKGGYGSTKDHGAIRSAHRVSYELFNGTIPEGLFILHKCDVKCCVNPDHLRLGTAAENSADMRAKNRQASGERVATSKLTADAVREIRETPRLYGSLLSLARRFGVERSAISRVRNGETWGAV